MVALLPEGAQVVVELDLARLRANPVLGDLVARAQDQLPPHVPGLPVAGDASALASSDAAVFAAYGVGTVEAATVVVLATTATVDGGVRIAPDLVALGPEEWTGQLATRAAIASEHPSAMLGSLRDLRARAVPKGATGAVVRVVARLSFDARIAFSRLTGFEAPAQLSLWGDVADDAALVFDVDGTDPGTSRPSDAGRRVATMVQKALAALADVPAVAALGMATSLGDARLTVHGAWVRAVIAIGPRHLARVAERARAMLPPRHEAQ